MKFDLFFTIRGPVCSTEVPNNTNPVEADSLNDLIIGLKDKLKDFQPAGNRITYTGLRIEEHKE